MFQLAFYLKHCFTFTVKTQTETNNMKSLYTILSVIMASTITQTTTTTTENKKTQAFEKIKEILSSFKCFDNLENMSPENLVGNLPTMGGAPNTCYAVTTLDCPAAGDLRHSLPTTGPSAGPSTSSSSTPGSEGTTNGKPTAGDSSKPTQVPSMCLTGFQDCYEAQRPGPSITVGGVELPVSPFVPPNSLTGNCMPGQKKCTQ